MSQLDNIESRCWWRVAVLAATRQIARQFYHRRFFNFWWWQCVFLFVDWRHLQDRSRRNQGQSRTSEEARKGTTCLQEEVYSQEAHLGRAQEPCRTEETIFPGKDSRRASRALDVISLYYIKLCNNKTMSTQGFELFVLYEKVWRWIGRSYVFFFVAGQWSCLSLQIGSFK